MTSYQTALSRLLQEEHSRFAKRQVQVQLLHISNHVLVIERIDNGT